MREAVIGFVNAWAAGGPAIPSSDLTLSGADGASVEVFSSHVMLNNAHGDPEMYCIDINTSERNRAERALRANETFLRTIIDEIPDPLLIKDSQGDFLLANQATQDMLNTNMSKTAGLKRIKAKGNAKVYNNAQWDLVDMKEKDGAGALAKIEKTFYPIL